MKLVVMKKGGQPGSVAVNPERVTYVRSSAGPFTDIHFDETFVTVDGTFDQVCAPLEGREDALARPAQANWFKMP